MTNAGEARVLSQVIPHLLAIVICDAATVEPTTGKKNLMGIFDRVITQGFPSQQACSLYVKFTDAEGFYRFEIRFVLASSDQAIAAMNGEMEVTDRLASFDLAIPFPQMPLPEAGRYEFQLRMNDVYIGRAFFDAVPRS